MMKIGIAVIFRPHRILGRPPLIPQLSQVGGDRLRGEETRNLRGCFGNEKALSLDGLVE